MFKTKEQIDEVSKRTGVPIEHVRKLGQMMSKVKLAHGDLRSVKKTDDFFTDIILKNSLQNLTEALSYFEDDFLKCKLW